MAKILEGTVIRDRLAEEMKKQIAGLKAKPTLAIFQVGDTESSTHAYVRQKKLFAEKIGAEVVHKQFSESATEEEIVAEIKKCNNDPLIHGTLIQLPLPEHLDKDVLIETINPKKDVDGLTSANLKLLWEHKPAGFLPATSRGILTLLDAYSIPITGKHVVVVGRSTLVGKPTMLAFLNRDATATIAHLHTEHLAEITKQADILVVAIGDPKFITAEYVKKGAAVVDVGINVESKSLDEFSSNGPRKLIGDVDFASVEPIASAISPVPGGVGPMTVLSLFQNLVEAFNAAHLL